MSFSPAARTALVLGRVSNLPTVWSNLLAGWWLAGRGTDYLALTGLIVGGSFLYVGGMYLNDFCDAEFDREYRAERPIPAGAISRRAVGIAACLWFAAGLALLATLGLATTEVAVLLLGCIVFYDVAHKKIEWAPLVMAACRLLLYPLAASAAGGAISAPVLIPAIALAAYVAGITYLARGESRPGKTARWSLQLLAVPAVYALVLNTVQFSAAALLFLPLFVIWLAWLIVPLLRKTNRSIGRVVAGLLAGIVLVDVLAVAPILGFHAAWLFVLFALALLLQRVIPAT
jgi:4-hydroxybenzoate polyprenyltransferase